jgi:hypothetical protein
VRGFAERDARNAVLARAKHDAHTAACARSEGNFDDSHDSDESDIEAISAAELRIESLESGFVPFQPGNTHFLAVIGRYDTDNRPHQRPLDGNRSWNKCTDGGREPPGPIAKSLSEAENCVYDMFNLRDFMFVLLGQLRQDGERGSDFYNGFAQCCNSMEELFRRRNLERSILVARADAMGPHAPTFKKELCKFIIASTEAEDNAPDNAAGVISALTDKFAASVGRAECNTLAKKAAYGDNGGGGGGGGFGAARQDRYKPEPRRKDKQRGARGGSDKRGSPRGDRRDPDQREPRGRSTRGNGGHESDDSRGGHAGHEQRREPRDVRGKAARGEQDRNGGGGRGGGGGGRGGGRPEYDRRQHGESSRQGQREARRGAQSDASSSD